MGMDAIDLLAAQQLFLVSCDLEEQLTKNTGFAPMVALLACAKREAVRALRDLISIDPTETEAVRALQAKVLRFDDLCEWTSEIVRKGKEVERLLSLAEREELSTITLSPADQRERAALGIVEDHDA